MEMNFHLKEEFSGDSAGYAGIMSPAMSITDAYVNGLMPELSFHSVLQPLSVANFSPLAGRVLSHSQCQMPPAQSSSPVSLGYFGEEYPNIKEGLNTREFAFELLKLNDGATNEADFGEEEPLINFFAFSPPTNPSIGLIDRTDFTGHFSHLPLQKSVEIPILQTLSANKSSMMAERFSPYRRQLAKQRRERIISDKIRCLATLLPWNRRMDMATLLEEAYNYVKFLQAQIRILQSMPIQTTTGSDGLSTVGNENPNYNEIGGGSVLSMLNRQQLLEVLLNSPAAHTVLYSNGWCVYSTEQILFLKKMAEKTSIEQMMFFPYFQY